MSWRQTSPQLDCHMEIDQAKGQCIQLLVLRKLFENIHIYELNRLWYVSNSFFIPHISPLPISALGQIWETLADIVYDMKNAIYMYDNLY